MEEGRSKEEKDRGNRIGEEEEVCKAESDRRGERQKGGKMIEREGQKGRRERRMEGRGK